MTRKYVFLLLTLMATSLLPINAQQFIGCLTDSGWAETPMLRKTFKLDKAHKNYGKVYVWVTSLGYHEVYINDVIVGNHVIQPAVSQLNKHAKTVAYDITNYLNGGTNEIKLWIGQGWGRIYGTPAAVMAKIVWVYGEKNEILAETDNKWEGTPTGYSYTGSWEPLQFGGERYDARIQEKWRPVSVYESDNIKASVQQFEGNRLVDTIYEHSLMRNIDDSTILIGFNRVITGWFQVEFKPMAEGTKVTMEYLDHSDAKPPYTETDIYIAKGNGRETFSNRFHMHSFLEVRIKGANIINCRALHISAVNPQDGATFECDDDRMNRIHDMVKYTLSCLTFSGYMVDCPHLERMGYGGDGNSSTMTLQTIWDVRDTYSNWMEAWGDAMLPDGELPYVAPAYRTGGGPYWSSFIVQAPWYTYINYGDSSLISKYYDKMCRWLDYIHQHSRDGLLQPWPDNERHTWFLGDWLAPEGVDIGGESILLVSNCVISECLSEMKQIALILGHHDDAEYFSNWRLKLNEAIHKSFYHPKTHTYANGTPLDQSYALLMGIPPDSMTAATVKARLIKDCHGKYRDHIAGGLMGVPIFTEWCIKERQGNLMATILRQPDYPGYLYMIENSGILDSYTTWESWDCGREGKEDRSRVHNCYNGIGIWFYQAVAGIRPDPKNPGYKHFFIDPEPVEGVNVVSASKPTPYGTISVEIENKKMIVEIPKGTTATIFPNSDKECTVDAGQWELSL